MTLQCTGSLPPLSNYIAGYELGLDYTNVSGSYPDFFAPRCQRVDASGQNFSGRQPEQVLHAMCRRQTLYRVGCTAPQLYLLLGLRRYK